MTRSDQRDLTGILLLDKPQGLSSNQALQRVRRLLNARVSAFLDHLRDAFPKGTPDELAAFIRT